MGLKERYHVRNMHALVKEIRSLGIEGGCVEATMTAMGSLMTLKDIVSYPPEKANPRSYFAKHGLTLASGYKLTQPISDDAMRDHLIHPKTFLTHHEKNFGGALAGLLITIGRVDDEDPHIIGVLPRQQMPRDVRRQLKKHDAHVIVDTRSGGSPSYRMTTTNIAENVSSLVANNISVELIVVMFLKTIKGKFRK